MHGRIALWIARCTDAYPACFAICTGALPPVDCGVRGRLPDGFCNKHGRIALWIAGCTSAYLMDLQRSRAIARAELNEKCRAELNEKCRAKLNEKCRVELNEKCRAKLNEKCKAELNEKYRVWKESLCFAQR
ncbi:hypothetical protein CDL15_Pgr011682 [Punica granatum]|uniref:Uncharacterized protein n=1 Tax=Punica granatum TaxID=22663 RepID=A0A218WVU4_PUNGR|nr:hypothetical protein CDL15_Pgr011682 [Punica granatum]